MWNIGKTTLNFIDILEKNILLFLVPDGFTSDVDGRTKMNPNKWNFYQNSWKMKAPEMRASK